MNLKDSRSRLQISAVHFTCQGDDLEIGDLLARLFESASRHLHVHLTILAVLVVSASSVGYAGALRPGDASPAPR